MKLIYLFLLVITSAGISAQVKIGDTGIPDANAVLELSATNKGLLLPRVALANTTTATPLNSHIQGMVIYNTVTAGDVTPGFYFNDGTKWLRFAPITDAWSKFGNAGTDGSNFIGTADAQDLVFRTNNTERLRISSNGFLRSGSSGLPGNIFFRLGGNVTGNKAAGLSLEPSLSSTAHFDTMYGIRNQPSFYNVGGSPGSIYGSFNDVHYGQSAYNDVVGTAGLVTTSGGSNYPGIVSGVYGSATRKSVFADGIFTGGRFQATNQSPGSASLNSLYGISAEAFNYGTGSNGVNEMVGVYSRTMMNSSGSVTTLSGIINNIQVFSGTPSGVYGVLNYFYSTQAIPSYFGFYNLSNPAGIITNEYGVYLTQGNSVNYTGLYINPIAGSGVRRAIDYPTGPFVVNGNGSVGIGTYTAPANALLSIGNGHLYSGGAKPTIVATAAIGTSGTASLNDATDIAGKITLDFGTGAWGTGTIATITFNRVYASPPVVTLTPVDGDAATSVRDHGVYVSVSATGFTINFLQPVTNGNVQLFSYHVIETVNN